MHFVRIHLKILQLTLAVAGMAFADWRGSYRRGEELLAAGRAEEARVELTRALAEVGDEGEGAVLDALGRAEFQAGRYREAQRHLAASVRLWPPDTRDRAVVLHSLGRVCLELGEFARAEELVRQSLRVLATEARVWQSLGQAQWFRGHWREAEGSFERALALADGSLSPAIASDLSGVLKMRGELAKAAVLLEDSIARTGMGQARARMRGNLGEVYLKQKDKRRAVEQLRQALAEMEAAVGGEHADVATLLELYQEALRGTGEKAEAVAAGARAAGIRLSLMGRGADRRSVVDWRDLR